jgi:hypothetical protein
VKESTKAKYCKINKSWYVENEEEKKDFEKVYLNVGYKEKDDAKLNGACWDLEFKKNFTPAFNKKLIEKFDI